MQQELPNKKNPSGFHFINFVNREHVKTYRLIQKKFMMVPLSKIFDIKILVTVSQV